MLVDDYRAAFPRSAACFAEARAVFPTGVTHDTRMMEPFPVYIDRASGSRKITLEGREVIDYFVGHGSLLLGHSPPDIVQAVQTQMAKATHPGACHELELQWAKLVQRLIPSAQRVRFTGSGTEATLMALRLSRIFTGRSKVLKFLGHFHGWHDVVTPAADPPYDISTVPGVPTELNALSVVLPPNDLDLVEETLRKDGEIGAVILEPTGGHWGAVPIGGEFLRGLRRICTELGRVLIFDEVITGFRVAPGGAQAHYGVTPDLTTLAKILAGGLPGGCVAGQAEILAYLEPRPGHPKMKHPGTYNGNPLSAAAGVTALTRVAQTEACFQANRAARDLRNGLNELFRTQRWPWVAYGEFSMIRVVPGYEGPHPTTPETADTGGFIPYQNDVHRLDGPKNMRLVNALRQGMLLNGVDWWGVAGMTSCEHGPADVAQTIAAFAATIPRLHAEGLL
ncbi:MAG: aspartate aminotransferase family protein [Gemmataceae bacterium]